jgi:hypothetical protein
MVQDDMLDINAAIITSRKFKSYFDDLNNTKSVEIELLQFEDNSNVYVRFGEYLFTLDDMEGLVELGNALPPT